MFCFHFKYSIHLSNFVILLYVLVFFFFSFDFCSFNSELILFQLIAYCVRACVRVKFICEIRYELIFIFNNHIFMLSCYCVLMCYLAVLFNCFTFYLITITQLQFD